jgi:hypothetical protein
MDDTPSIRAAGTDRAASRTLEISRQQLTLGQIAYLALLNAQQTYQQTWNRTDAVVSADTTAAER